MGHSELVSESIKWRDLSDENGDSKGEYPLWRGNWGVPNLLLLSPQEWGRGVDSTMLELRLSHSRRERCFIRFRRIQHDIYRRRSLAQG